jgi:hypothetical protein
MNWNTPLGRLTTPLLLLRPITDILEATENDLIDLLEQELVSYKYTI